ncbi:MAG: hypothetical protein GXO76_15200 [Calditrichaeota bacterium]|nr:hypothetical protein [Calditrichota bacterium]
MSHAQIRSVDTLLRIVHTQENWPYVWLNRLEWVKPLRTDPLDSLTVSYQRFFLKGIAYFFIVPSYSSRQEFNQRIQILEKVVDNWKKSLEALEQLEKMAPRQREEWESDYHLLQQARTAVFNRYLMEKKTKRYQAQTFSHLFDFSKTDTRSGKNESFIQTVVTEFERQVLSHH